MRLVISEVSSLPVPAEFRYRPSDPYAVKVIFHTGAEELVEWVIARETIAAGLRIRAGAGDVQVWPSQASEPDAVCLALTSPEGTALLEAPQAALQTFLRRTNNLVPPGTEGQHIDIDRALDHAFRHSNDPRPTSKARKPTK
ncbi:SsgA family sporulation/cell division regulator [Streptomyces sp. NPDC058451]|uniref:SsgA family sporulation/cell division regulator n=1 Tax=Streptomyces sp. NPDC058451 TaxID=3346506 RepID=UPI003649F5C5